MRVPWPHPGPAESSSGKMAPGICVLTRFPPDPMGLERRAPLALGLSVCGTLESPSPCLIWSHSPLAPSWAAPCPVGLGAPVRGWSIPSDGMRLRLRAFIFSFSLLHSPTPFGFWVWNRTQCLGSSLSPSRYWEGSFCPWGNPSGTAAS